VLDGERIRTAGGGFLQGQVDALLRKAYSAPPDIIARAAPLIP
jgi:hypothetical protein